VAAAQAEFPVASIGSIRITGASVNFFPEI